MTLIPTIRSVLLAAALAVPLAGPRPAAGQAPAEDAFRAADRNGDGRLDEEEYARQIVQMFAAHDADQDGSLTLNELMDAERGRFRAADANRDGKLTLQEIMKCKLNDFRRADTDGNGMLNAAEVASFTPVAR